MLDSAYSNHCFTRKRDGVDVNGNHTACYATSALKQEQELTKIVDWTPDELVARQARLTEWALQRWKIAPAADSTPPTEADTASDILEESVEDTDPMLVTEPGPDSAELIPDTD
ncbi:hypothetical protein [Dactylosporangium darangshiense]|uniref:hypothetical protein n=1 Tax=Dactylosporangium darangshiense TaxID=579108 RepID=UPI0031F04D0F